MNTDGGDWPGPSWRRRWPSSRRGCRPGRRRTGV